MIINPFVFIAESIDSNRSHTHRVRHTPCLPKFGAKSGRTPRMRVAQELFAIGWTLR